MKKFLIMGIISTVCGLFGCTTHQGFSSLEVDDFEKAIADKNVIRLDVRTPEEYAEGHIEGAQNIDVLADTFEKKACATLPKNRTIALYCRSGKRSKTAATILSAKGYKIMELNTGFNGWTAAGKKISK